MKGAEHEGSGSVTIALTGVRGNSELVLFDGEGKAVRTIPVPEHAKLMIIDRMELKSGTYFYNLFLDGKVVSKGKVRIE